MRVIQISKATSSHQNAPRSGFRGRLHTSAWRCQLSWRYDARFRCRASSPAVGGAAAGRALRAALGAAAAGGLHNHNKELPHSSRQTPDLMGRSGPPRQLSLTFCSQHRFLRRLEARGGNIEIKIPTTWPWIMKKNKDVHVTDGDARAPPLFPSTSVLNEVVMSSLWVLVGE